MRLIQIIQNDRDRVTQHQIFAFAPYSFLPRQYNTTDFVRSLDLSDCPKMLLPPLSMLSDTFCQLRSLNLEGLELLTDEHLSALHQSVARQLWEVRGFACLPSFTDKCTILKSSSQLKLGKNPLLTSVDIGPGALCHLEIGNGMDKLRKMLLRCSKLRTLYLGCRISATDVRQLLDNCEHLERVVIGAPIVGALASRLLSKLPKLRFARLVDCTGELSVTCSFLEQLELITSRSRESDYSVILNCKNLLRFGGSPSRAPCGLV